MTNFSPLPTSALTACQKQKEDKPDVILLHTGRMRGNFYPLSLQKIAPLQHYPYMFSYIQKVREEASQQGAAVILVDLGDSLEGSFASYATGGENVAAFLNAAAFDAILLGNLDSQVKPELLAKINAVKLCPFLDAQGQPAMPGTQVAAKLPVKLPNADQTLPVFLVANFYGDTDFEEFPDRFPASFGTAGSGVVPDRSKVTNLLTPFAPLPEQRLVLFAWMKFEAPEVPPTDFLGELREAGVNAILAQRVYGSSQRDVWALPSLPQWQPPVSQNILRRNGGFTIARMDLKRDGTGWRVLRQELVPMTANTAPASQEAVALMEQFAAKIAEADRVLTHAPSPLSEQQIFVHCLKAFASLPGAEAVLYSTQSVRADLPEGEITASRLFEVIPWTGPLVMGQIDLSRLTQALRLNPRWTFWAAPSVVAALEGANSPQESEAQPSSGNPPRLRLATSRFFADLLTRRMGLPDDTFQTVEPVEFEYFARYFDGLDAATKATMPEGWRQIGAQ